MTGCFLQAAATAKNISELALPLKEVLIDAGIKHFTLWQVASGVVCTPVQESNGVKEGLFDLYDLGYESSCKELLYLTMPMGRGRLPVYQLFLCGDSSGIQLAVTLHKSLNKQRKEYLEAVITYLNLRAADLEKQAHSLNLLVNYQKKLNFIEESSHIFKSLTVEDALANILDMLARMFHAQAYAAIYDNYFTGFGLNREDISTAFKLNGFPLEAHLIRQKRTEYIDKGVASPKFGVDNLFILHSTCGALFLFFNIESDSAPDSEYISTFTNLISTALDNARYHEQSVLRKVEEAEMAHTGEILNQFVRKAVLMREPVEGYGVNYPARSTGGDFMTLRAQEGKIFICVADVCGKGYSAAVFTVMLATLMDTGIVENPADIDKIVKAINSYIMQNDFEGRFVTCFIACYDEQSGILSYIGCGHEPAFLMRNSKVRELASHNLPLGIMNEAYQMSTVKILKGDLLFIYSDGVTEYISFEDLKERVRHTVPENMKGLVTGLYRDLVIDSTKQKDDFTCMAIKF